jgi:nuclear transcription factor Y, alpha
MIQFGHQVPDYDSSATQSTSGSQQEVSGMSEGSLNEQNDRSGLHYSWPVPILLY